MTTLATLEVSHDTFDEISSLLRSAGYHHVFLPDGSLDMSGIALALYDHWQGKTPPQQENLLTPEQTQHFIDNLLTPPKLFDFIKKKEQS